jgi:hypothetical protein
MGDTWPHTKKVRMMVLRKHGMDWPVIAEQLGADAEDCRLKYDELSATTKSGHDWTTDDMNDLRRMREEESASWEDIAMCLRRTEVACKARYLKITKPTRPWTTQDVAMLMQMRDRHMSWEVIGQQLERKKSDCRARYEEECRSRPVPDYTGGGAFTLTLSTSAYDMTAGRPREERLAAMKQFRESLVLRYERELHMCDCFIEALTSQNHGSKRGYGYPAGESRAGPWGCTGRPDGTDRDASLSSSSSASSPSFQGSVPVFGDTGGTNS